MTIEEDTDEGSYTPKGAEENLQLMDKSLPHQGNKTYLYMLTVCSAVGGFLFGYDTGVISGALVLLARPDEFDLTVTQAEAVVSSTIAGAIIGSLLGGPTTNAYGRKPVIVLSSVVFTFGSVVMGEATTYGALVAGRIAVGIGVGLASMAAPMYISEAAPSESRGTLVTVNTAFITGGQFFASVVDGCFSSVPHGWRYMLGLATVPSVLQFIGFMFLPESPRWLISMRRNQEGRDALRKIRGCNDVQIEEENIRCEVQAAPKPAGYSDIWVILLKPAVKRTIILGCTLQALQQFAGINTVMYYSATILQMAGFRDDSFAIWLGAVVSFSNFLFTSVGMYFVERSGRRSLTLLSLAGVTGALVLLGFGFFVAEVSSTTVTQPSSGICSHYGTCFNCVSDKHCGVCFDNRAGFCIQGNSSAAAGQCTAENWYYSECPGESHTPGWVIFAGLFGYLACFAPGMGSMPWTINSEIYPLEIRSFGISLATTVNWLSNLFVSFTFLSTTKTVGTYGAFWLYATISAIGWLFLSRNLPETKGLPLNEIQSLFEEDDRPKYASGPVIR